MRDTGNGQESYERRCWQNDARQRVGDALTAQSGVDRGISLLTRDGDFRAFAAAGALDLVV